MPYYSSVCKDAYSPVFALIAITLVTLLSSLMARFVPYFRQELTAESKTRLTSLDGLRGILCFSVMFYHAAIIWAYVDTKQWSTPPSPIYALLGEMSVALFFCITAFLFWSGVIARSGNLSSWRFLRGRLYRLLPLYIFSCVLALAIVFKKIDWFSLSAIRGLATMALMGVRKWGVVGGVDLGSVDAGVTWSLQYEWGFYLFLPALASIARDKNSHRFWFIMAGVWVTFGMGPTLFFFPGILAAYVSQIPSLVTRLQSRVTSIAIICVVIALPYVVDHGFGEKALVATTVLFVPIACGNSIFGLLTMRGLRLMGIVSYSVYLLHGIILYLAQPTLAQAKHGTTDRVWLYWCCISGLGCATLLFSMLTYRWIEWPLISIGRLEPQTPAAKDRVPGFASVPLLFKKQRVE